MIKMIIMIIIIMLIIIGLIRIIIGVSMVTVKNNNDDHAASILSRKPKDDAVGPDSRLYTGCQLDYRHNARKPSNISPFNASKLESQVFPFLLL